ncbi:hypothetical protein KGV52_00305 [Candidatus Gracilibacteria bacterium]|nr:hypothetical protein [Candidatus Gracilibacteria bacterium]
MTSQQPTQNPQLEDIPQRVNESSDVNHNSLNTIQEFLSTLTDNISEKSQGILKNITNTNFSEKSQEISQTLQEMYKKIFDQWEQLKLYSANPERLEQQEAFIKKYNLAKSKLDDISLISTPENPEIKDAIFCASGFSTEALSELMQEVFKKGMSENKNVTTYQKFGTLGEAGKFSVQQQKENMGKIIEKLAEENETIEVFVESMSAHSFLELYPTLSPEIQNKITHISFLSPAFFFVETIENGLQNLPGISGNPERVATVLEFFAKHLKDTHINQIHMLESIQKFGLEEMKENFSKVADKSTILICEHDQMIHPEKITTELGKVIASKGLSRKDVIQFLAPDPRYQNNHTVDAEALKQYLENLENSDKKKV